MILPEPGLFPSVEVSRNLQSISVHKRLLVVTQEIDFVSFDSFVVQFRSPVDFKFLIRRSALAKAVQRFSISASSFLLRLLLFKLVSISVD